MFKKIYDLEDFDFDKLAKAEKNPRVKSRLLCLHQLSRGLLQREVAANMGVTRQTVASVYRRFSTQGLAGLQDGFVGGGRRKLTLKQEEEFKKAVLKFIEKHKGRRLYCRDFVGLCKKLFGVDYTEKGMYTCLERLGLNVVGKGISTDKEKPSFTTSSHSRTESLKEAGKKDSPKKDFSSTSKSKKTINSGKKEHPEAKDKESNLT